MLPQPATPVPKPSTRRSIRVTRDAAILMLRNNLAALGALLLFNWLFPVYPRFKKALLPKSWLEPFNKLELGVLTLAFGINILVALISIRYPRAPYAPIRTPSKPAVNVTPVRRRVKGLGTTSSSRPSAKSFSSSGYASTPLSTPSRMLNYSVPSSTGTPLNQSGASSISAASSFNSSPLAAYMGRHASRTGRPIDTRLLDSLTADENSPY